MPWYTFLISGIVIRFGLSIYLITNIINNSKAIIIELISYNFCFLRNMPFGELSIANSALCRHGLVFVKVGEFYEKNMARYIT